MSADDWTVALDDGLVGRLQTCTGCGTRRGTGIFGVYPGRVAIAYWLCSRCLETAPQRQAMETMLAQRYGGQKRA
jgi:hypothetical protein